MSCLNSGFSGNRPKFGGAMPMSNTAARSLPDRLKREWVSLSSDFLPVPGKEDSIWKFSREATPADPAQGWKLHISATVLTAGQVLAVVGPLLKSRGVLFKGPASLDHLSKLNSGLYYGYTQVGKCLTIYPRNDTEAIAIARKTLELTRDIPAPAVPFDLKFGGCVYYRYGAFRRHTPQQASAGAPQILKPDGTTVFDDRKSVTAKPEWIEEDPFIQHVVGPVQNDASAQSDFRVIRALGQRGKGGVYQAIDFSLPSPRVCLLKEGRRAGESSWDGWDGYSRVTHEASVLKSLSDEGAGVPRVFTSFEVENNIYVAMEFIGGKCLQEFLANMERRMSVAQVAHYGIQISEILSRIHAAGWVWRDCKPSNLILTETKRLRPIDFEGAWRIDQPNAPRWASQSFAAPEVNSSTYTPRPSQDLYSLGVILHYLLWGSLPSGDPLSDKASQPKQRRRNSVELLAIVSELLSSDPEKRPYASAVMDRLVRI
jgi:hypothetical protein